jgi:hypothetical protein
MEKKQKTKHPCKLKFGSESEKSLYWKWRLEVGRLVSKAVPAEVKGRLPLTQEDYLQLYKDGYLPHHVRDYIVNNLL